MNITWLIIFVILIIAYVPIAQLITTFVIPSLVTEYSHNRQIAIKYIIADTCIFAVLFSPIIVAGYNAFI